MRISKNIIIFSLPFRKNPYQSPGKNKKFKNVYMYIFFHKNEYNFA